MTFLMLWSRDGVESIEPLVYICMGDVWSLASDLHVHHECRSILLFWSKDGVGTSERLISMCMSVLLLGSKSGVGSSYSVCFPCG